MKKKKEAIKKKICYKCKRPIMDTTVCSWYVVHVCEDEDEYQCWDCWTSKEKEEFEKEYHARKILQEILSQRSK